MSHLCFTARRVMPDGGTCFDFEDEGVGLWGCTCGEELMQVLSYGLCVGLGGVGWGVGGDISRVGTR